MAGHAWDELSDKLAEKFRELHFTPANLCHRVNRVHREIKLFDEHQFYGQQKENTFVVQICKMAIKSVIQNTKFTEIRRGLLLQSKVLEKFDRSC